MLLAGEGRRGGHRDGPDIGVANRARREALNNLELLRRNLHRVERRRVAADLLRADEQRIQAEHVADDIAVHAAEIAPGYHALAHGDVIGAEDAGH